MRNTVELKNRNTGEVVFTSNCDNNTYAKCLAFANAKGIELHHLDLAGQDLSGGHFVGMDLMGSDLRGAILDCANFLNADLTLVNLTDVHAHTTSFQAAKLHKVSARNGDFTGSWFNDAMSMEGDFRNAKFDKGNLLNFMTRGVNFKGSTAVDALVDETDTRIAYKWPRTEIPVVCETECQHCVGCGAWK